MSNRSLHALVLTCAVLALPAFSCGKGGGSPCPIRTRSAALTTGDLIVSADGDLLTVEYLPADDRSFEGALIIRTTDGEFLFTSEIPGETRVVVPWETLSDDVCGQTISIAVEGVLTEPYAFTVVCQEDGRIAASVGTGGGGTGGDSPNCPR